MAAVYTKLIAATFVFLALASTDIRFCVFTQRYQFLAMLFSIWVGFVIGKVYAKVQDDPNSETKRISSLVMNGQYKINF